MEDNGREQKSLDGEGFGRKVQGYERLHKKAKQECCQSIGERSEVNWPHLQLKPIFIQWSPAKRIWERRQKKWKKLTKS